MISRKLAVAGIAVLVVAGAAVFEGTTTIHLTFASNYSVVHARPGQVLQVALGWNNQHVLSNDTRVVTPLAIVGGSPPTQYFVGAMPGKTQLLDRNLLAGQRCLAMLCGWRVEVDVG